MPLVWIGCAVAIVWAALNAQRSDRATRIGELALAVLYLLAGALVNAVYLWEGEDYADFAEHSPWAFVRETWSDLVVPHAGLFIGLLIAFEVLVGTLALLGRERAQIAMVLAMGFHVALVAFGWGFAVWSVPMLAAMALLLRAERLHEREQREVRRHMAYL